jgi:hypothetical protein
MITIAGASPIHVLRRPATAKARSLSPSARTRRVVALLFLAVLITLFNALKPLHVDDTAYVAFATHIAQRPLDPYDFQIYWDYTFQPANQVLAPPVLPYWIAAAMRCLGNDPFWWKLSLLPFHLLLVGSLFSLFRRFAAARAMLLTWMTVLSPALLPSINLMLDVPALALGLTATALFLRAADRKSIAMAVAAGLVAGVAMQTKYTAFVTPAVLMAYGWTHRRLGLAMRAALAALALFAAWECFVALRQGETHFLHAVQGRHGLAGARMRHLLSPLASMTAAVAPGLLLLAAAGWTRSWRWPATLTAALLAGVLLIGWVPSTHAVLSRAANGRTRLALEAVLYGGLAVLWWTTLAAVGWRLLGHAEKGVRHLLPERPEGCFAQKVPDPFFGTQRVALFLLLWFALEMAGYFALSPFPAARRMLGVVVVASLVVGRFVSHARSPLTNQLPAWRARHSHNLSSHALRRKKRPALGSSLALQAGQEEQNSVRGAAVVLETRQGRKWPAMAPLAGRGVGAQGTGLPIHARSLRWLLKTAKAPNSNACTLLAGCMSISFGITLAVVDWREARATQELAEAAVQIARATQPCGKTWFCGTWSFPYYAMRDGLYPLTPDQTLLRRGDLLVLSEQQLHRIDFRPDQAPLEKLQVVTIADGLPWRTLACYYAGRTPLQHQEGPRLRLTAYRVLADFVPTAQGELPAPE